MPDFDCVIIGSGIGGLVAGGRLASKGYKVLILEQNPVPGGYLQSFRRRSITFDSCVDCFSGLDANGPVSHVLSSLGVEKALEPIRIDPIRTSIFPGLTIHVHADIEKYISELKSLFPSESAGIDSLFRIFRAVYSEIKDWGDFITGLNPDERIPVNIVELSRLTYGELLDTYIKDTRLKAVLSDRCPFYGVPPTRAGAVAMIALIMSYFSSGAWRIKGGSQRLADAICSGIKATGSEVIFKKKAEHIIVENGKAIGVATSDGDEFTAKTVISNIDYYKTFEMLSTKEDRLRALEQKVTGASSSFFILYAGVRMDLSHLGRSSSIGYYPTFDMDYNFTEEACFNTAGSIGITIPSLIDPDMAPDGTHSVTAHEMTRFSFKNEWKASKGELTDKILKKADLVIPGICRGATHVEAATPATLERYTANTGGAAYGWTQSPGLRPLNTFIDGLYLAGHWEGTGGGVVAAAYSGHKAAGHVEKKLG